MRCYVTLNKPISDAHRFRSILRRFDIEHYSILNNSNIFELFIESESNRRLIYECVDVKMFTIDRNCSSAI